MPVPKAPLDTRDYPKTNLISCTPSAWADCVGLAMDMGRRDELLGQRERTGKEIAEVLTTGCRGGHVLALRAAYKGARFHIGVMGKE